MTRYKEPSLAARTAVILSYPAGALIFFGTIFLVGLLFTELLIGEIAKPTQFGWLGVVIIGLPVALIVSLIASTISFFVFSRYLIRAKFHPILGGMGFVLGPAVAVATFMLLMSLGPLLDPDGKAGMIVVVLCLIVVPTILGKALVDAGIRHGILCGSSVFKT